MNVWSHKLDTIFLYTHSYREGLLSMSSETFIPWMYEYYSAIAKMIKQDFQLRIYVLL
jgi:hypothetical protein